MTRALIWKDDGTFMKRRRGDCGDCILGADVCKGLEVSESWCTWGPSPPQPHWSEAISSGWEGRFKGRVGKGYWGPSGPYPGICILSWWQMESHWKASGRRVTCSCMGFRKHSDCSWEESPREGAWMPAERTRQLPHSRQRWKVSVLLTSTNDVFHNWHYP